MGAGTEEMKRLDIIKKRYDQPLLITIILLVVIGTVMLYSASQSVSLAQTDGQTTMFYLVAHLKRLIVGITAMAFFMLFDYRKLKQLAPYIIGVAIALLLYTKVWYLIKGVSGAGRWLYIGSFSFQTSDFARLALIIFLASFMARKKHQMDDFKSGFVPPLIVMAIIIGLVIFQPDFSTAIMLCLIGAVMLFIGGARFSQLSAAGALSAIITIPIMMYVPYSRSRIMSWLSGNTDTAGDAYQITQSMISLGNGGVLGMGLGNSIEKNHFLPTPHTDFIVSIIGEEFGLIGTILLLTLFLIIFQRGIKIAKESNDPFGVLLAVGITFSLILYAFVNTAVVTNIFPVTGLPMPLISYGGTNILMSLSALGILLNISQSKRSLSHNSGWRPRYNG